MTRELPYRRIGLQLQSTLSAKKISRSALANRLYKTESWVAGLIRGRNATLRTWHEVATAMGCSLEVFFHESAAATTQGRKVSRKKTRGKVSM